MLISECLTKIYKRFEKSSDTPDPLTEDYVVRLEYVNASIDKWENELGVEWKELYKTLTGSLVNGVFNNTSALADFKKPAGKLYIGSDVYDYVRPERVAEETSLRPTRKIYTVTGSKGTYAIRVYPAVSADFVLDYKKRATKYTTGVESTPEIEMSDPEFIIHDVLGQLYLDDDNGSQANVSTQIATAKMDAMKLANEVPPFNNNNDTPEDGFSGFGN